MDKANIGQIFRKEMKALVRDRARLFNLIALPILIMVIFMVIFGGTGTTKYALAVVNLDEKAGTAGSWSQSFIGNLTSSDLLTVNDKYTDNATALADLQQGKVSAIIIIPRDFSDSCASFWTQPPTQWIKTTIPLYVDEGSAFANQAMQPIVQKVLLDTLFGQKESNAISLPVSVGTASPVSLTTKFDPRAGLVSGILIYAVFLNTMTFAIGGVDDREKGVLKRYQMSRATSGDLLVGQTCSSMVTTTTQVILFVFTGLAFGFNPAGGIAGLLAGILVSCICALFAIGLGLLIGALVKTSGAAIGMSLTVVMIMAYFSGLFVPLEFMPPSLQQAAQIFPSYYANDAVKSLVARGASLLAPQILFDIAILGTFGGVIFLLGWLVFRRRYE